MTSAAPCIGEVSASPQQLAWNIGTTGSTTSRHEMPRGSGGAGHHRMRPGGGGEIDDALGMAGRARRVAHAGGGALVEGRPGEIAVDLGDPRLIGHGIPERGL